MRGEGGPRRVWVEKPGAVAAVVEPFVPAVLATGPHPCWRQPAVMQKQGTQGQELQRSL